MTENCENKIIRNLTKNKRKPIKKKRTNPIKVYIGECKYNVVKRVIKQFHYKIVEEHEPWDLCWTDLTVSVRRLYMLKSFQTINHFLGTIEIWRKDLLAKNLNRMRKIFPSDYNFFPKTWLVPKDFPDLLQLKKGERKIFYIIKPEMNCQGKGIFLTKNLWDLKGKGNCICQEYIERPYLIDGYKFDLRVYVLLTSCDPLRIYVFQDGLARFATVAYERPKASNLSNMYMHLTNYSINRKSDGFDKDNSKRSIKAVNKWMEEKGIKVSEVWSKIDDIIIKTIISILPNLKHVYNICFPHRPPLCPCFEILGFDILLNRELNPYLLEVNHSPSFNTMTLVDKNIKPALIHDALRLINLKQRHKFKSRSYPPVKNINLKRKFLNSLKKKQEIYEDLHSGLFRKIYPKKGDYSRFINSDL